MNKSKLFIETTGNERVIIIHFNTLVSSFISRIASPKDEDKGYNDDPMKMFGQSQRLPEYIPHVGIIGVEQLFKNTNYSLVVWIGKCFKFTDVINSIINCLEMDFSPKDYIEWLEEVKGSYPKVDSLFSTNRILTLNEQTLSTKSKLLDNRHTPPPNKYGI